MSNSLLLECSPYSERSLGGRLAREAIEEFQFGRPEVPSRNAQRRDRWAARPFSSVRARSRRVMGAYIGCVPGFGTVDC